ncbi:MAG TPA: sulfotransferase [Chitinophagaceae bacterium]|nr:sulfotransferase [Chitinophagaceae bacterium]
MRNWYPYKLLRDDQQLLCRWLNAGDKRFSEPFFDDTITKIKGLTNYRIHSVSNIELLADWAEALKSIAPSVFIFHVSRCGSTLVAQLFDTDPANIVLAEVPFLDDILRMPYREQQTQTSCEALFKAAVQFYGQQRTGQEKQLIIKTDSWHICFYQTIRKLYPQVPFVLLYRHPAEVMRSHQTKRGMQAVPGIVEPEVFGFKKEPVTDLDGYLARVLERYFELFKETASNDELSLLVNYNEGMLNIVEKIAAFSGIDIPAEVRDKMKVRAGYNAKYPDEVFNEDKSSEATPAYLSRCMQLYAELEAARG